MTLPRPIKSMLSNTIATIVDFSVASALFYVLKTYPAAATALGSVVGAFVSFGLSRVWAFEASGALMPQMARYAFVSSATAALNAGGVLVLTWLHLPFLAAWAIARAVVFSAWSYPLQRWFVFGERQNVERQ